MSLDQELFVIDQQLQDSCLVLGDWPLSRILLKNEQHYPWLILVPRRNRAHELLDLTHEEQHLLMDEVVRLSRVVQEYFNPTKLNVASIGNKVKQLHIHVVGRMIDDPLWPESIWQSAHMGRPYPEEQAVFLARELTHLLGTVYNSLT